MASSVPLVPNYVYIVIRLKVAEGVNRLVGKTLLCHYGETNDIFPIGGLFQPSETLTTAAIFDIVALQLISALSRTFGYI